MCSSTFENDTYIVKRAEIEKYVETQKDKKFKKETELEAYDEAIRILEPLSGKLEEINKLKTRYRDI